jgi:pilus assembly protein Flp/PilA
LNRRSRSLGYGVAVQNGVGTIHYCPKTDRGGTANVWRCAKKNAAAVYHEARFDNRFTVAPLNSGATAIEYGLIAAGISLAIIAVVNGLGTNLNAKFDGINSSLK